MARKKPHEETVHGKRCVATTRRDCIEVDVWLPGSDPAGPPDGEWSMPRALGPSTACVQAAIQTTKKRDPDPSPESAA